MILSGIEIQRAIDREESVKSYKKASRKSNRDEALCDAELRNDISSPRIVVAPHDPENVGPNSIDVTLYPEVQVYVGRHLDSAKPNKTTSYEISEEGMWLMPRQLYLGRTIEYTESFNCVPMMEGRSSLARLGLSIHVTGGFGDVGFCGTWTLEMTVVKPVKVYPRMKIAQLFYYTVSPDHVNYGDRKNSKYQGQVDTTPSRLHREF